MKSSHELEELKEISMKATSQLDTPQTRDTEQTPLRNNNRFRSLNFVVQNQESDRRRRSLFEQLRGYFQRSSLTVPEGFQMIEERQQKNREFEFFKKEKEIKKLLLELARSQVDKKQLKQMKNV